MTSAYYSYENDTITLPIIDKKPVPDGPGGPQSPQEYDMQLRLDRAAESIINQLQDLICQGCECDYQMPYEQLLSAARSIAQDVYNSYTQRDQLHPHVLKDEVKTYADSKSRMFDELRKGALKRKRMETYEHNFKNRDLLQ